MSTCKLAKFLDGITQSGQSDTARAVSRMLHNKIYGPVKSGEMRLGYITEDITNTKQAMRDTFAELKILSGTIKTDIAKLKAEDKLHYEASIEEIQFKVGKLLKAANNSAEADVVMADGVKTLEGYAAKHKDTQGKLDKIKTAQDSITAMREEKKEVKTDNTVAAKLIKFSKSVVGKVRNNTLFHTLIKGNSKTNQSAESKVNDERLSAVGLGDYFKAVANGTNIAKLREVLGTTDTDMTQYTNVLNRLVDGINGLFAGGNIQLTDTTNMWDIGPSDHTVDGFGTISRLLLVQAGKEKLMPTLIDEVKDAIAVATIDWLYENGSTMRATNRSDKDLLKLLGEEDEKVVITDEMREGAALVDGLITQEANALGSKIYKYLQLKRGPGNELVNTEMVEAKLKTELGLMALAALDNAGAIRLQYRTGNAADTSRHALAAQDVFGTEGEAVKSFVFIDSDGIRLSDPRASVQVGGVVVDKGIRSSIDTVRDAVDAKVEKHGVYATAAAAIPKLAEIVNDGVTGIVSAVSWMHKKAIQKQSGTPNTFTKSYFDIIDNITGVKSSDWVGLTDEEKDEHAMKLAMYLGYKDENGVHVGRRPGVIGKNNAILLDIRYLMEARAEFGDEKMFAKWKVITNNRFMIDSNKLNWQDKKLHRHSVETSRVVIKGKAEEVFKLAMAQAFGIKVDKLTRKTALDKKYEEMAATLYELLTDKNGEFATAETVKKAMDYLVLEKGNEPTHAMMGLGEFIEYHKWLDGDQETEFKSGLRLEVDDTTSGYILKLLQMPIFMADGTIDVDKLYEELARGGVTDTDRYDYESYGARIETKQYKDSYEQPAEVLKDRLQKAELKPGQERGLAATIKMLGGKVNMADNTIEEITRVIMKHPFMTLNYGSAIGTIISNLLNSVVYGNTVTGARGIGGVMEDIYSAIENGNEAAIDEGVEVLRGLVELANMNQFGKINEAAVNKKMAELDKQIENKTVLMYEMFNAGEIDTMQRRMKALIKGPITSTFESSYGELIKATNTINEAMTAQFRIAKIALDARIEKELADRVVKWNKAHPDAKVKNVAPLTTDEVNELVRELAAVFPVFDTALAIDENGGEKAKVFIAGTKKTAAEDYAGANMSSWSKFTEKSGVKSLGAASEVYKLIEKYSSGAVIPIHFLDASRQAVLLADKTALGVHDAYYGDAETIEETATEANKIVYELARGYSLVTEMLKSMVSTINGVDEKTLDKYESDEIFQAIKKAGSKLKDVFADDNAIRKFSDMAVKDPGGALDSVGLDPESKQAEVLEQIAYGTTLRDKFEELLKLQVRSEAGRAEIFNNNSLRIEHSYMEGSEYSPKVADEYVAKVVDIDAAAEKVGSTKAITKLITGIMSTMVAKKAAAQEDAATAENTEC